jgi:hypothetical protein
MGDPQGDGDERGSIFRFPVYRTPYKGCPTMKSKQLQKISYGQTHQSDERLDDQQENIEDSPEFLEAARNRTTRVNLAVDAKARAQARRPDPQGPGVGEPRRIRLLP